MQTAESVPELIGIGAISIREVLYLTEDAQQTGVAVAPPVPVSYQQLTAEEVLAVFNDVTQELSTDSTGRRNTSIVKCWMVWGSRQQHRVRAHRGHIPSSGLPRVAWPGEWVRLWAAIAGSRD